jgi:hypothetical protein
MRASDLFEQQIHRIHELLEGSGAEVTWNDRISDPDNPSQNRQIDVTIKKDGNLTIVECRLHASPQGVKWIEELMGRRQSLMANTAIAVSSSGFTKGALIKAKKYGIVTHDLYELTNTEIEAWGKVVTLTLFFYQYSELELNLLFSPDSHSKLNYSILSEQLKSYPGIQSLFNAAAEKIDEANLVINQETDRIVNFGILCTLEEFRLCDEPVIKVDFRGKASLTVRQIKSPLILAYGAAKQSFAQRVAVVEHFELGETALVHDANKVSILLDVSSLTMPPFCQFHSAKISSNEEMDVETFELLGVEKLWVPGGKMSVQIAMTTNSPKSE